MSSPADKLTIDSEWGDEELLDTARENLGLGADAGLPDDVRFRAGVVRVIRKLIARGGLQAGTKQPSVFLLLPSGPQPNEQHGVRAVRCWTMA